MHTLLRAISPDCQPCPSPIANLLSARIDTGWPANAPQIDIVNPELYHYDGDCIAKAADMGFPGLVDIRQRQVRHPDLDSFFPLRTCPALC